MKREDYDLAFMLKYENVAWYEDGKVRILDRRVYPYEVHYVICETPEEVAKAISDMVTQSEGPYVAATMGMVLACNRVKELRECEIIEYLNKSAYILSHARITTVEQMKSVVEGAVKVAEDALKSGKSGKELVSAVFDYAYKYLNDKYKRYTLVAKNLAKLIPQNAAILTQCFAGTVVGTFIRECKGKNKNIKMFCAETRPYFQGLRLTASVARDMGVDVTVISDNMPAYVIKKKNIDVFTSASDVITMDGYIINKVGTFQIALVANYYNVPYYVTGTPDPKHRDLTTVKIEERDPESLLKIFDKRLAMEGVKGYYPAFDITPPEFCKGIVTDKKVYKPEDVWKYFE